MGLWENIRFVSIPGIKVDSRNRKDLIPGILYMCKREMYFVCLSHRKPEPLDFMFHKKEYI